MHTIKSIIEDSQLLETLCADITDNIYGFVNENSDMFSDILAIKTDTLTENPKIDIEYINNLINTIKITHKYNSKKYYTLSIKKFIDIIIYSDISIQDIQKKVISINM